VQNSFPFPAIKTYNFETSLMKQITNFQKVLRFQTDKYNWDATAEDKFSSSQDMS